MILSRALPSRFRRARIALVGFGDVGQRIWAQRSAAAGGSVQAPALRAVGRRVGWDLDQPAARQRLAGWTQRWIILVPPRESSGSDTRDRRSRALAQSLLQASGSPPRRLVYISTTGVYGDHAGQPVQETDQLRAEQPRSLRRIDAEQVWRALGAHVLRVPGITAEDRLPIERIQRASPALCPEDDVFTNHIHADDLARIAWAALWRGRPRRVTNAVMQDHLKMGDYFDLIADRMGLQRCPRISRTALAEAVNSGVLSPMMASFMQDSRRVVGARLRELRIALRYPRIVDVIQSAGSPPTQSAAGPFRSESAGAPPVQALP